LVVDEECLDPRLGIPRRPANQFAKSAIMLPLIIVILAASDVAALTLQNAEAIAE